MRKPRAAIYARHSSDKQNPASSSDQTAACETLARQLDAEVAATYADPEISGYRRDRPGLMRLLRDIGQGLIDVVVCEALDRIARDGEDIAWLGKKLSYHRVRLFTNLEREIDEVKLAVAGLLGSMFLANLRTKTFRGLKAAVLAGRLAGGRAYGYRKVARDDGAGRPVNGVFEIDPEQALVVERIFRDFADGRSSIQIATALNLEGIPGPRGGEWNASTIRGDPKKLVGILNNPLYRGRLVWGRREWRKNPDSDKRERRYRLRDKSEWVEVDMPDLRIVAEPLVVRVQEELESRKRPTGGQRLGSGNRPRHLLSGLIKCGRCGANYTIVGMDYYRCARNRQRGTCDNAVTVRVAAVEDAALGALQSKLLTPNLVKLFAEEFAREVDRLTRGQDDAAAEAAARMVALDREIDALAQHFLAGSVSPTLSRMLSDREEEKTRLIALLDARRSHAPAVIPHPTLVRKYEQKILRLREALNDELIRGEATEALRSLIASVTVRVGEDGGATIEVEASTATLIDFAGSTKTPHLSRGKRRDVSVEVVAGTRFHLNLHDLAIETSLDTGSIVRSGFRFVELFRVAA